MKHSKMICTRYSKLQFFLQSIQKPIPKMKTMNLNRYNLFVTSKNRNYQFTNLKCCKKARKPFKTLVLFLIYYFKKHFKPWFFSLNILLTSSNNQISEFRIPNILFTYLIKQQGETFCNLYIEITQPFLILSISQRSLKMCSQNH